MAISVTLIAISTTLMAIGVTLMAISMTLMAIGDVLLAISMTLLAFIEEKIGDKIVLCAQSSSKISTSPPLPYTLCFQLKKRYCSSRALPRWLKYIISPKQH